MPSVNYRGKCKYLKGLKPRPSDLLSIALPIELARMSQLIVFQHTYILFIARILIMCQPSTVR